MEGIIKFKANWKNIESVSDSEYDFINPWRQECFNKSLIGVGDDRIGYGNISFRIGDTNQFIISGSATGHIPDLKKKHYSKVIDFNILNNSIDCEGRTIASSESMSHAALYAANDNIKCVIHLHHKVLWENNLYLYPTTDISIEYGTVDMAQNVFELAKEFSEGAIIMGGHKDGIIIFGSSYDSCLKQQLIRNIYKKIQ
ncbi:MAG: class II aldolase/adducin family protein [Bacteroidetes bacterium]|nr:MAG: class II aldolase/adducin family protein [Bacteroidota bacterium]